MACPMLAVLTDRHTSNTVSTIGVAGGQPAEGGRCRPGPPCVPGFPGWYGAECPTRCDPTWWGALGGTRWATAGYGTNPEMTASSIQISTTRARLNTGPQGELRPRPSPRSGGISSYG